MISIFFNTLRALFQKSPNDYLVIILGDLILTCYLVGGFESCFQNWVVAYKQGNKVTPQLSKFKGLGIC